MACGDEAFSRTGMYHPENGCGNRRKIKMQIPILALPECFDAEGWLFCLFFGMSGVYGMELVAGDCCFFLVI
jgi:hypothetical protein